MGYLDKNVRKRICLKVFLLDKANCHYFTGSNNITCVKKYYTSYVLRETIPIDYEYYHEVIPSSTTNSFRIMGGSEVPIQEVPYQVQYGSCGGVIISPAWVLTAAHCGAERLGPNTTISNSFAITVASNFSSSVVIHVSVITTTIQTPQTSLSAGFLSAEKSYVIEIVPTEDTRHDTTSHVLSNLAGSITVSASQPASTHQMVTFADIYVFAGEHMPSTFKTFRVSSPKEALLDLESGSDSEYSDEEKSFFVHPVNGVKYYDYSYDAFIDIFDEEVMKVIVDETNRYAHQVINKAKAAVKVTSDHIVIDREKYNFVKAGSARRWQGEQFNVCAHFTHPLWKQKTKAHLYDWDFQLLMLERPIPVTRGTRPIAVGAEDDIRPGELLTVTGWGYTRSKASEMRRLSVAS
ncbi:Trypsin 3A1 [Eumeta japonica]|uniref:Trypsin 3A1 n=1 Tax=Eumeta variegata TaxID=151549 RepID=A0A4C1SFH5_EUMVA|nr:Trypsin 3A1 [Eumeta japonica]